MNFNKKLSIWGIIWKSSMLTILFCVVVVVWRNCYWLQKTLIKEQTRLDTESHGIRRKGAALSCSSVLSFKSYFFSQVPYKCKLLFHLLLQNAWVCAEKLLLHCCIMLAKCYLFPWQTLLSESSRWTASVVHVVARLPAKSILLLLFVV